ncbi:MAG: sugar phosphate isomerase/epimerase [Acidobacteria bacterium]|nr:sugar phosphate isomerase/epimerase [Acidobacteriota bacterium]
MRNRLTRREMVKMGLGSMAALAVGGRPARAEARRLHLGLVTYNVAKGWDLDTVLRLVEEAGFEGVEFRSTHAHGVEPTLGSSERAEVKRKCDAAGMKQVSLGTACEFQSPDPAVVRKNVDEVREWVLLARDLGARGIKVRPNGLPEGVPVEKTLEQIGRALTECGEIASDHGVEIWVEVHGQGTKEPANMRRIMDACGHPAVGVTWNSNDSDVKGGSVRESFDLLRPFIRCCHITDLWSEYPYAELFALLQGSGYDRFTLCEYPQPVAASDGAAWLRRYRKRWEDLQQG